MLQLVEHVQNTTKNLATSRAMNVLTLIELLLGLSRHSMHALTSLSFCD